MGSTLLVAGQIVGDFRVIDHRIVNVQNRSTWVPENRVDLLFAQTLEENLRAGQKHVLNLLFLNRFTRLHIMRPEFVSFPLLNVFVTNQVPNTESRHLRVAGDGIPIASLPGVSADFQEALSRGPRHRSPC